MDEIREVEMELRRLREDAEHYKREATAIKKEKKTLEAKNEYMVNKLKEASYVYGEAGKRLLYFINNQVNPVSKRLSDLEADDKRLAAQDKALNDSMISLENIVKSDLTKFDKRLAAQDIEIKDTQVKVQRAITAAVRRAEKGDIATDQKIDKTVTDFDTALNALGTGINKRTGARLASLEKKVSAKLDMLKDRSLLLGKDIEAMKKFEGDIQGLEGKLQATVANLTQTRIDTEKLSEKLRSEMTSTKTRISRDVSVMLDALKADMASFEKEMGANFRKGQSALNRDLRLHGSNADKRMSILEGNLGAASKAQKEAERIFNQKVENIIRHESAMDESIGTVEANLTEHMDNFSETAKRKELLLKNELQRMNKAVDGKLKGLDSSVDKRISLMAKDIQHLKDIEVQIGAVATEVGKRKEDIVAVNSRLSAMASDVKDKAEKDDMRIRKQLDLMKNDIENSIETAESRMTEENVKSFSIARHALKKDIHALREENATLKADVRNLKTMGAILNDLQQGVMGMEKKITDSSADMRQLSSAVKSDIEKQTLKASKDLQAMSSRMKAELNGVIARERERFATQSAELDTRYKELAKTTGDVASASAQTAESTTSNAKKLALLESKFDRLMKEIVGMKKEYKLEMGKLLKELEG